MARTRKRFWVIDRVSLNAFDLPRAPRESRESEGNDALVPLCRLLLWRHVPRERSASSSQWNAWTSAADPVRVPFWRWVVVRVGQCLVGILQLGSWLHTCGSRRQIRSSQHTTGARTRCGTPGDVDHAGPDIRAPRRRTLSAATGDATYSRPRSSHARSLSVCMAVCIVS